MQQFKCQCHVPDPQNWSVIRISGRDRIIRCSACKHIWHTVGKYSEDLPESPCPNTNGAGLSRRPSITKAKSRLKANPTATWIPNLKIDF